MMNDRSRLAVGGRGDEAACPAVSQFLPRVPR